MLLANHCCIDFLEILPPETVDLVVTSPPYDDLRTYGDFSSWSHETFKLAANGILKALKPGGVIIWVVNDKTINGSESGSSFRQALYFKEIGLNLHDTMIWKKDSATFPDKTRYYSVFEYMFVLSKGNPKTFNPLIDRPNKWAGLKKKRTSEYKKSGERTKTSDRVYEMPQFGVRHNVWEISVGANKSSKVKKNHPAIFPEALARDHILSWSNPGDTVMDPFMGSGTVGTEALKLGRDFIGCEINPAYFNEAEALINSIKQQSLHLN